jgi:UDP-N-acetylglucosamine--N-acetylmuramyl-(pentapeptide) pyrophosphoryl-undecaprenol N-acetylglucosamine transferase
VVLSGGGTGGHIYPGLAVAEALRQADPAVELLYVGARGRMDERIVPAAGVPFEAVAAAPLRTGSPLSALRNVATLIAGTAQAWRILGRFQPDVVFATGGYASVPVGVAARIRRRPLLVYLPDISAGWAVRLLARLATRVATTAGRAAEGLPAARAEAVGYPVRAAFWTVDRTAARRKLGLPENGPVLLVTGASQGAHNLNVALANQLDGLLDACHVLHLTGAANEREMAERRDALPEGKRERYHVFGYLEEMAGAMSAADLAVMRAGASTLGELPAAGLPAILVPGVYEGGHNQRPNARYLEEQGAAVVLENEELARLTDVVRDLLTDEARRRLMAAAARRLAWPDAAQRIATMLQEIAA